MKDYAPMTPPADKPRLSGSALRLMCPNHAVWPTGAPDVCVHYWDQNAWDAFEDRFRPKGYTGGRFDQEAWAVYAADLLRRQRLKILADFGVTL
jgi:hypothetical protein